MCKSILCINYLSRKQKNCSSCVKVQATYESWFLLTWALEMMMICVFLLLIWIWMLLISVCNEVHASHCLHVLISIFIQFFPVLLCSLIWITTHTHTQAKTMQLYWNELATVNTVDWFDANDKRRKMNCIERVCGIAPRHIFSVFFYRFRCYSCCFTDADVSRENRFLFIQWKLIASINDWVCVWLKWCGPWIKSMWLN